MAFVARVPECSTVKPVAIGSLAVLCPLLKALNVGGIIDSLVPTDPQAEFPHGAVLEILLAARLQQPTALVNIPEWAARRGIEYLWKIPPEKLNDDRLGRALDAFFPHRYHVLAQVTTEVLRRTKVELNNCHFDTTHLVFYGAYDGSHPRPTLDDDHDIDDIVATPAHITHGYLTRYRMVQFGATSYVDAFGALPVACHPLDGNRDGHPAIHQQYELLRQHLKLPENMLFVSDRGTYSAAHLARLKNDGYHALCAVPWQDFQALYDTHTNAFQWNKASYLSLEQQRRRESNSALPQDEYQLAVLKHAVKDTDTGMSVDCRVIFVHSSANDREAKIRRVENVAKIRKGLDTIAAKLVRAHPQTTRATATNDIHRLLGQRDAARFFRWEILAYTDAERDAMPTPARGYRKPTHRLVYALDEAAMRADEKYDGLFALITTAPITQNADTLFTQYKRQCYVERGHHELKTPLAVTPVFLKSPERVEALLFLMFLALQASMTMERLVRQSLPAQTPKKLQRPTAEQILRRFDGYGLIVTKESYGTTVAASRLTTEQRDTLNQLSLPSPAKILQLNLPPPPIH